MTEQEQLLPCPFCKKPLDNKFFICTGNGGVGVWCMSCGAMGSCCDSEEKAFSAWNGCIQQKAAKRIGQDTLERYIGETDPERFNKFKETGEI